MAPAAGAIRIGVSGWTYPPWRGGAFYPKGLPQKRELAWAAGIFDAIEVNGTFYGMRRPADFAAWAASVPPGFQLAVKGPRFITHMQRLEEVATPLANFMASGVLRLGAALGPILWQLPPSLGFEPERLEAFLALLPKDSEAAVALARRHDDHLRAPAWLETDADRPIRHALEIRHDSFRDPAFVAMLRRHGVALVTADGGGWPCLVDLTADFVYCRLHGAERLYESGYGDAALDRWAGRVRAWAAGEPMHDGATIGATPGRAMRRDVYLFFDNTARLRAPADAQALMRRLGTERRL